MKFRVFFSSHLHQVYGMRIVLIIFERSCLCLFIPRGRFIGETEMKMPGAIAVQIMHQILLHQYLSLVEYARQETLNQIKWKKDLICSVSWSFSSCSLQAWASLCPSPQKCELWLWTNAGDFGVFAVWTETGDRECIESDPGRQRISEWNESGVALGSWEAQALLGLELRLAAENAAKATQILKEGFWVSQQSGEVFVWVFLNRIPWSLMNCLRGVSQQGMQYLLLKIRSCCVDLLMRGGKVRPGGALQEKPLTFGGAEQPCDQTEGQGVVSES